MDLNNQKYISLEQFLQGLEEKVATQNNNNSRDMSSALKSTKVQTEFKCHCIYHKMLKALQYNY